MAIDAIHICDGVPFDNLLIYEFYKMESNIKKFSTSASNIL